MEFQSCHPSADGHKEIRLSFPRKRESRAPGRRSGRHEKYLDSLAELGQAHFPWPAAGRHGNDKKRAYAAGKVVPFFGA